MQSIAVSIQMNWRLVANSLMRPLIVVLILPELEIVASLLGGTKPHLVKQLLVVSTMTALDDAIALGRSFGNQRINPSRLQGQLW